MNWLLILISLITGSILGVFYFGGLWITVQYLVNGKHPYSLFFVSFFIRILVVLAVFYLIVVQGWIYLVVSLLGLIITRMIIVTVLKPDLTVQSKAHGKRSG
jgi:F1F0 ATPase subunit 2